MTDRADLPLSSRVAASIAASDTESCVAALRRLPQGVGAAEVRLDLMDSFSVPDILARSPVPLVLTCRPEREGGRYSGPEAKRLDILRLAYESGAAYVDVEADCVDKIAGWDESSTRVIVSRHWYDRMPADLWQQYDHLRGKADVVKLVGHAASTLDAVPVLELLRDATTPVIALAMGKAGQLTRIIGPGFESCLLTYGVPDGAAVTASGQLTVVEMIETYHLDLVTASTEVTVHICTTAEQEELAGTRQAAATPGLELHVPVRVALQDGDAARHALASALPTARIEMS